jgi:hypothetical protein
MANVNLITGKIYGCKKGTRTYYHEEGHLRYESTDVGRSVRINQEVSIDFLLTMVALGTIYPSLFFKILIAIGLLWKIFSVMKEEKDCWVYANNKMREKRDDDRRCKRKNK